MSEIEEIDTEKDKNKELLKKALVERISIRVQPFIVKED